MENSDTSGRRRFAWKDVLPLTLAISLGLLLPGVLYLLARPLALLTLAFTVAAALSPAADLLERRMPRSARSRPDLPRGARRGCAPARVRSTDVHL